QSALAWLARAKVQTNLALMTGRPEDAEQAIKDVGMVALRDSPLLLITRVHTFLTAASCYRLKDHGKYQSLLGQAAEAAGLLMQYTKVATAYEARCWYLYYIGDDENLLKEVQRAKGNQIETNQLITFAAEVYFRGRQFREALKVLPTD